MIVRDEAENLPACLESLGPWVQEICIVDTGSTDDTITIAESFGARVERFEWIDDFAAARNASIEMATQDWVLVVDADETLAPGSGPTLRDVVTNTQAMAFWITMDNLGTQGRVNSLLLPRLFRRCPEIRFARPIHESIAASLCDLSVAPETSGVRMVHTGYLPEAIERRDKHERNKALLRRHLEVDPDDLYSLYKFATSLKAPHEAEEQRITLALAMDVAHAMTREERRSHLFLPLLYDRIADRFIRDGNLVGALRITARGLADLPGAVELLWRRGDIAWRVGDLPAARRYLTACFRPRPVDHRYATATEARTVRPAVRLAEVALAEGDFDAAQRHVDRALGFDPQWWPAHVLEIRILLTRGDARAAMAAMEDLIERAPTSTSVRLLAGELAWAQGDVQGAREMWTGLSADTDEGHSAHCALAIADLSAGDLEAAAAGLEHIRDRDLGSAACRLLVSVACGKAYGRGNALRSDRLITRLIGWLRDLVDCAGDEALSRFAVNAADYVEEVPGLDRILERNDAQTAG